MKRILTAALALVLVLGLLSTTALAADAPKSGICDVVITEEGKALGYSFDFGDITATKDIANHTEVYPGAEYFTLKSSSAGEGYKLVLAQSNEGVPTVDTIVYIDQSADSTSVSFKIYPSKLTADGKYYVYISSSASTERTLVATFSYYQEYKLGDADNNGKITVSDATAILQMIVGKITFNDTQKLAADVDGKNGVTVSDASYILQFIAGKTIPYPLTVN